ncbi:hypothetical protein DFP72DRAFT_846361 [Ephemerocybe angulata]|uniref:Uncharacterized protein n=1 Tax=Ephemerocybe angulata TaxID=980116 RepID=A0A8H6I1F3_9AGAR|nr:hypothetical protein DFP72DRAFT_846361 [Tulosesus angulatus]
MIPTAYRRKTCPRHILIDFLKYRGKHTEYTRNEAEATYASLCKKKEENNVNGPTETMQNVPPHIPQLPLIFSVHIRTAGPESLLASRAYRRNIPLLPLPPFLLLDPRLLPPLKQVPLADPTQLTASKSPANTTRRCSAIREYGSIIPPPRLLPTFNAAAKDPDGFHTSLAAAQECGDARAGLVPAESVCVEDVRASGITHLFIPGPRHPALPPARTLPWAERRCQRIVRRTMISGLHVSRLWRHLQVRWMLSTQGTNRPRHTAL